MKLCYSIEEANGVFNDRNLFFRPLTGKELAEESEKVDCHTVKYYKAKTKKKQGG